MTLNKLGTSLVIALLVFLNSAILQAQPLISFDARSVGMGGTGVASSKLASAAYSNPALVSQPIGGDNFQLLLPVVGVNANDPQGLIDDVDAFNLAVDNLDPIKAQEILAQSIGKPLTVSAYAGTAFGFTVDKFALVFLYNKQYIADFRTTGNTINAAFLVGTGAELTAVGVAIPIFTTENFKLGITPKVVDVNSFDYLELLIDSSGNTGIGNTALGEKQHGTSFNIDVGAAYDFKNGFVLGLVARNLKSQEFTTVLNSKIKLEPQTRAGIAYNGDLFTIAADADLNENEPIAFSEKTQLITLGAELNFLDWMAIRIGYQKNTASTLSGSMKSIGLGFTPFGVGVDIAAIGNEHAIGGAVQLSFTF
ncbi:MAG: conjugal transfer protein TraF [Thiohalomonadales bacterium]